MTRASEIWIKCRRFIWVKSKEGVAVIVLGVDDEGGSGGCSFKGEHGSDTAGVTDVRTS